jgi:hypothetical protein
MREAPWWSLPKYVPGDGLGLTDFEQAGPFQSVQSQSRESSGFVAVQYWENGVFGQISVSEFLFANTRHVTI